MTSNSQKPKEWMGIASGPSYGFAIAHVLVLLFKGPTRLLYLALVPLCLTLSTQPCPTLNNSTTSNIVIIPTFLNLNNSTRYCFLNYCCSSFKP